MKPAANRGIIGLLVAKETWAKALDGILFHDPKSKKAESIRHDVTGSLGWLPFSILILFCGGIITIAVLFAIYL